MRLLTRPASLIWNRSANGLALWSPSQVLAAIYSVIAFACSVFCVCVCVYIYIYIYIFLIHINHMYNLLRDMNVNDLCVRYLVDIVRHGFIVSSCM